MKFILFFACFVLAWQMSHVQSQATGLNTRDVIALLNKQMRMNETLFTSHRAKIRRLSHHLGRTWHEGFSQLSLTQLPNITDGCAVQIGQFTQALRNEEEWAYRVIDSFGKIPSGIVLGNFAWIGELSECINITAIEETWRGEYVLLERPMDPLEIFRPGSSLNFKYGMCMPNNCTQEDIYEIISLVLKPIPEELNLLKPNESYIQIRTPKVLTTGAISTLSVLGAFLLIVIIGTVFDLYKRFQFEVKYSQLISLNTSSEEVAATNETAANETSQTHHHNPHHHRSEEDFEKRFSVEQENEPIFSQILLNFSAYTNARKVFEASKNKNTASNLKCLNGIRVLSLAWVILGHTYIFALTFSDNMMIVSSWVRQINLMIISNAFFSVDSFFLLSGFLTCYVFMREVDKTPLRISHLIKYYFHRIWRLTPLYAIVFLVSLYLSPYLGDSPLYPTTGVEPEFCKQRWWINFLYINNLVDPQKMCFGLSWYLANDTQFHFFAPIILIPFALKKKVVGYILSALFLTGNTIAIALTMYYNEGMEVAQYGNTMYTEFFNKFYVLPWCRIAPYIVGLLTAHIFIQHKKSARKNIKLLDYFLWLIALTTMTLMVFGPYRDAKGEEPLSRTARIFYQSFSRTAWSAALGYVIYSCALFNNGGGGFVNKILSCWIWSPLSKINYAAFLIHVLVLTWFNANQEHPLHLQHSLLVYAFVSNWIFSYVLAFFFHVFIEAPLIGLEKFLFFHR